MAQKSTSILQVDKFLDNTFLVIDMDATCDNHMKVYFDGNLQTGHPNVNDWTQSDSFSLPEGTQVVGIECADVGKYINNKYTLG